MDAILTAALGAAPELGGVGVLLAVLTIVVRREVQTTERHSAELSRMADTHSREMTRQAGAHDTEVTEIQSELARVRAQRDAAEQEIDAQRRLRRQEQDQGWTQTRPQQTPPAPTWADPAAPPEWTRQGGYGPPRSSPA